VGIIGLVCLVEAALLFLVLKAYQKKDKRIEDFN